MYRNIGCYNREDGTFIIEVQRMVEDNRKAPLYISEEEAEDEFKRILNVVKNIKEFESLSMEYEHLDYSHSSDAFWVPSFSYDIYDKKIVNGTDTQNTIPKEWMRSVILTLSSTTTMQEIKLFLNVTQALLGGNEIARVEDTLHGGSNFFIGY